MTDAPESAGQLSRRCIDILRSVGHTDCHLLTDVQWIPRGGDVPPAVVCGCGFMATDQYQAPADSTKPYESRDPIRATLDLIDPTQTYTPEQVEQHILDVLYRLETGALFERECIQIAESAVAEFNRVYWATIHSSELASELKRKAEAEVECEQRGLTKARDEAKMMRSAASAALHNLRAVLSGYQSVAKSITAAYNPGGSAGRF